MKDSNKPDCLDYVVLTIEGCEDLSVRPWKGPSALKPIQIEGAAANFSSENLYALIENDEDITVQPWRQPTPMPIESVSRTN
jgi:hypothetical protein